MWEDATLVVCLLGFVGAIVLMLAELPTLIVQTRQAVRRHR